MMTGLTKKPLNAPVTGALMMLGASAIFAGTTLMAKMLGQGLSGPSLHPLQVSAGRFCFAFLGICIIAGFTRPTFKGANLPVHLARSLFGWAGVTCIFAASALMPLADAIAISFTSPVITMLLAIPLLGELVGRWRWIAAGISFAGALILIQPGTNAFQLAALIALAGAFFQGTEAIAIKHLADREPPLRILFINNAIGAVIALTAATFVWHAPTPAQWGILMLIGLSMICAQSLFIQSMRRGEASYMVPFFYATLLFSAVYDFAIFTEIPTATTFLGATLITAAALLLAYREHIARHR
jgi:drug/metabolite transporter (DMT)-like permease